jgi:phage terminase large subunit-like protein
MWRSSVRRRKKIGDILDAAADAARRLVAWCEDNPLEDMDWTRKQSEFRELVRVTGPEISAILFRAGNQIGKTIVGAALTIDACLSGGRGFEAWVVCTSWSQSVAIMTKVWSLVPKGQVVGARFRAKDGFGKDNPVLQFRNGAIMRFRTTGQGPEAFAGATIHWAWIDEPTGESIYRELQKRVRKNRGRIIITLTPVNLPCEWLRKLVEKGTIREVHAKLDADALTFVGSGRRMTLADGTPMDDAWISTERFNTPEAFVPVVCDGEWETRLEGVFFTVYDPAIHRGPVPRWAPSVKRYYALGIDYAAADREFGQVAILAEVGEKAGVRGIRKTGDYSVYVHDEVFMSGASSLEEFADAVVNMIGRNGLRWESLGKVYGDLPTRSRFELKSNILLQRQIARVLQRPYAAVKPPIWGAKEGRRDKVVVDNGCRWLYALMAQRRFLLSPKCVELSKCLQQWDRTNDHPRKDGIDALRYALRDAIFPFGTGQTDTDSFTLHTR